MLDRRRLVRLLRLLPSLMLIAFVVALACFWGQSTPTSQPESVRRSLAFGPSSSAPEMIFSPAMAHESASSDDLLAAEDEEQGRIDALGERYPSRLILPAWPGVFAHQQVSAHSPAACYPLRC